MRSNLWIWISPFLLLLAVGAAYWGSETNARLREDTQVVWENPSVTGPGLAGVFLGHFYNVETELHPAVRPVSTAVARLEYESYGQPRSSYQLTNIVLHAIASILLFRVFSLVLASPFMGLLGALLFAVHPAVSSSVLRLAGMSECLALCFLLLAVLAAARVLRRPPSEGRPTLAIVGCWAFYALAAGSKEAAMLGAPLIWIWSAATSAAWSDSELRNVPRLKTDRFPDGVQLSLGIGVITLIAVAYRMVSFGTIPEEVRIASAIVPDTGEPFGRRLALGLAAIPTYFRLIAFPAKLGYSYDFLHALQGTELAIRVTVGATTLAALTVGTVLSVTRKSPRGALLFGMTLFGLIGALGVVAPVGDYASERALYFVIPGLIGLLFWSYSVLRGSASRPIVDGAVLVVLILAAGTMSVRTAFRTNDYRSRESLIESQIATYPTSAQGVFDKGNLYLVQGNFTSARAQYEKAITLREDFWMAWVNLGASYSGEEEPGLARRAYEAALDGMEGKPEFAAAKARAHFNHALILMRQNLNSEAIVDLDKTLEIFPNHLRAHANLGFIYRNSPKYDAKAIEHLNRAIELEPDKQKARVLENALDYIAERRAEIDSDRQRRIDAGLIDDPTEGSPE